MTTANQTVRTQQHVDNATARYNELLLQLCRLEPESDSWSQTHKRLSDARLILLEYKSELLKAQEQQPEPTVVEPASEPELKVKSIAQEKAEANARVALANKGKSAKDKAEALDVPVATVRKVEKAKAATKAPASDKPMDTAAMKKLAKELGVSYEGIKFTSSKARDSFRATLEQAQANHNAKVWNGLSPDRQAKLTKAPSVDPNRASARAIAL